MSDNSNFPPSGEPVDHLKGPTRLATTILLVEDDESVREFVRVVLERAGYTVVTAHDGNHGLDEYLANPNQFDLLLSDVIMPNRTGPELVEAIRRFRPDAPVLFMSAYTGRCGTTSIEMPPGVTLLEKPFSIGQLLQAIAEAIPDNG